VRVCAVDIGTNSVRTIVADVRAPSHVEVVRYDGLITRLGDALGASKRLNVEAIERTARTAAEFIARGRELGAAAFKLVATSAAREAENAERLLDAVREATGFQAQIVTGEREAELVLAGVNAGGMLPDGPALLVDVGGGSTELIASTSNTSYDLRSVNVGAVRLTEQFLTTDPPSADEVEAAARFAGDLLRPAVGSNQEPALIGLGGTITTMAAMLLELDEYDAARVHGYGLTLDETEALLSRTSAIPLEERKGLRGLESGRADIIVGGMIIVRALLHATRCDAIRACTTGILHGIALAAAAQ
jgi:exopolyphosphatase/guanosine-5'-triphosphate,3'-diphosphate pyrophosphatase